MRTRSVRLRVHAASGHRLGDAAPRGEGPADLRLLPGAGALWAAAAAAPLLGPRPLAGGVAACCLAAALTGRAARRHGPARRPLLTAVALALLCAAAGGAVAGLHTAAARAGPLPELARAGVRATVVAGVDRDPRHARPSPGSGTRSLYFPATAERVQADGMVSAGLANPVLVIVRDPGPEWSELLPGTRLRLTGDLAAPRDGPGSGPVAVLFADGSAPPRTVARTGPAQRIAGRLRSGLAQAAQGLPGDAAALLPALVVGDTSRIPADLQNAVRTTDMSHLIVVSGAHLSIILAVLIGAPGTASRAERGGLAARLGIPLRTTAVLGGAMVVGFVVLCRPGPSVLRASLCGGIALLAIATGRRRSLLPALAAAVLLIIGWDPAQARSFGFLLSVLATGALLTLAPRWSLALQRRGLPPRLAEGIAAAAAAQAVCGPVVTVFAARVGLVGVPCNLLAQLAFAPATVLGWAALVVQPLAPPAAAALAWLASWPARWIAAVARTGAALPGAELSWPGGWAGAALLAAVTGVCVALARRLPFRPWPAAGCALLLVLALTRPPALTQFLTGWPPPGWRLVACDVGQGDALVLSAGPGAAVVIDTGPDPEAVDGCLRGLGVRRIPVLILTHFHADHVAGLPGALRGREVGLIQVSSVPEPPDQAAEVRRAAAAAEVPVTVAARGEESRAGGDDLRWRVLWPPPDPGGLPANDASVTLLVRTAGLTVLLPGDLEPPAQQRLLAAYPELPRVDVLKVPHHGSAYQYPPLLERLRPRLAVISCGTDNDYGHPAPGTVDRLRRMGAAVLRTDRHGAVAVVASPDGPAGIVRRAGDTGPAGGTAASGGWPRPRAVPARAARGPGRISPVPASRRGPRPARRAGWCRTAPPGPPEPPATARPRRRPRRPGPPGRDGGTRAAEAGRRVPPPGRRPPRDREAPGCAVRGSPAHSACHRAVRGTWDAGGRWQAPGRPMTRSPRSPSPWARRSCCWTGPCARWWRPRRRRTRIPMCATSPPASCSRACWRSWPARRCSPSAR